MGYVCEAPIYDQLDLSPDANPASVPPRAIGAGSVTVKSTPRGSAIADLRMSGCIKLLFTPSKTRVNAVMLNTSGGLTSGDILGVDANVQDGAALALTTQAAERAYRAPDGKAHVRSTLTVGKNAQVLWFPQELILFEGAKLDRELSCDLAPTAKACLVEPVVFGRHAMGETLSELFFSDRIRVTRAGIPLFTDVTRIDGRACDILQQPAVGNGAGAMVTLVYAASDADAKLSATQPLLSPLSGASLVHPDMMIIRALAADSLALRRMLLPVLDLLTDHTLPTSWRL